MGGTQTIFNLVTQRLQIIQLECTITNKLVPFNCVSRSLRTILFIIKEEKKVVNNKTQVQLQIRPLNIHNSGAEASGISIKYNER